MTNEETIRERLAFRRELLDQIKAAYHALLSGQVQSYTIGSRSLTRLNLKDLREEMRLLENEIDGLEVQLRGGRKRRAVAVVPRDF